MKGALLLIPILVLVGADAAPVALHNVEAENAIATHRSASSAARRAYLQALIAADKLEIASLNGAIHDAMANGDDVDDVVMIRDAQKIAQAQLADELGDLKAATDGSDAVPFRIVRATYGLPGSTTDIGRLASIDKGIFYFEVNPQSLSSIRDPVPGQTKYITVDFDIGGIAVSLGAVDGSRVSLRPTPPNPQ
jgi:hypothetical protein